MIKRSEDGFPRELAQGIWWMGGCFPIAAGDGSGFDVGDLSEVHSHVAAYLIVGETKTVIIDTGTPANWAKLSFDLDQVLGDRPLDYVVPTHWEVPHAGNLERLLTKYPRSQAHGDLRDFHLAHPDFDSRLHIARPREKLELGGGYEFIFLPAPIKDIVSTTWGFEAKQKVLFVADGFSYTHHVSDKADEDSRRQPVRDPRCPSPFSIVGPGES
jgi:flavorubredoxin